MNDDRAHRRSTYGYALRYTPGTDLARRFPAPPRGRFRSRDEAERIRAACPNADRMQVIDVRTGEVAA